MLYYADERHADASAVYGKINGLVHGEFYVELSERLSKAMGNRHL